MKQPGDEIIIRLIDPNYPDNDLKECRVNRDPSLFPTPQRHCLYKILGLMDKINELNKQEERRYDRSRSY